MKTVSQVESLRLSSKSSAANWSLAIAHTLNSQMAAIFVLNWFLSVLKYFLNILLISLNQYVFHLTVILFSASSFFIFFTKIFNHNYLLLTHKYHLIFFHLLKYEIRIIILISPLEKLYFQANVISIFTYIWKILKNTRIWK